MHVVSHVCAHDIYLFVLPIHRVSQCRMWQRSAPRSGAWPQAVLSAYACCIPCCNHTYMALLVAWGLGDIEDIRGLRHVYMCVLLHTA